MWLIDHTAALKNSIRFWAAWRQFKIQINLRFLFVKTWKYKRIISFDLNVLISNDLLLWNCCRRFKCRQSELTKQRSLYLDVMLQFGDERQNCFDRQLSNCLFNQLLVGPIEHRVENLPVFVVQTLKQKLKHRVGARRRCFTVGIARQQPQSGGTNKAIQELYRVSSWTNNHSATIVFRLILALFWM